MNEYVDIGDVETTLDGNFTAEELREIAMEMDIRANKPIALANSVEHKVDMLAGMVYSKITFTITKEVLGSMSSTIDSVNWIKQYNTKELQLAIIREALKLLPDGRAPTKIDDIKVIGTSLLPEDTVIAHFSHLVRWLNRVKL